MAEGAGTPEPIARLIEAFHRLPGIGPKSAQRLAYHVLRMPIEQTDRLADAIRAAKAKLRFCAECQSFSEQELCDLCSDPRRSRATICVVGEPRDVAAMERIHEYKGQYHVLHGALSPIRGVIVRPPRQSA